MTRPVRYLALGAALILCTACCHLDGLQGRPLPALVASGKNDKNGAASENGTGGAGAKNDGLVTPGLVVSSVSGLVFGAILDELTERFQRILESAQNTGLVLEVQAASQALAIIAAAKEAYADLLDRTMDRLGAAEQKLVADLRQLLEDTNQKVFDRGEDLAKRLQVIANALPFSSKMPQVVRYDVPLVYAGASEPVRVTFQGNFPALRGNAYLHVAGYGIPNAGKTTTELSFFVPPELFLASPTRVQYSIAVLKVPYRRRCYLLGKCCELAEFSAPVIAVPASPGSARLVVTRKILQREWQDGTGPEWIWDASQKDVDKVECHSVEPGWTLDATSVQYDIVAQQGKKDSDWYDHGNKSTLLAACWQFKAVHRVIRQSGKLTARLRFRMFRDVLADEVETRDITLDWHGQRVEDIPAGATWKLVYTQFDGRQFEMNGTDSSNPYVQVKTGASSITIKTLP